MVARSSARLKSRLGQAATAQVTLYSQGMATEGIPAGGPYVPPGSLYDNEQSNGSTSLLSQNGATVARSADDFTLDGAACPSGEFAISQVRLHQVINDGAPQSVSVDFYDDNGSGTAPTPADSIAPIATFPQTSQVNFGPFGVGTSIFEITIDTPGLLLAADTTYWISGFGTGTNPAFSAFFAASEGAIGTTDNGVIIAPTAGVATWTPADVVIGPPALAFSFAIDGTCVVGAPAPNPLEVPTASTLGLISLAAVLALLAVATLVRRRSAN